MPTGAVVEAAVTSPAPTWPLDLVRHGFSHRVVQPTGACDGSGIYIVGEAPGEHEDETGVPFHPSAPAGSVLDRMLKRMGHTRDRYRIANAVWQRPPKNYLTGAPWEHEALALWRPFLMRDIEASGARAIVALGNTALRTLTDFGGEGAGVTQVRGYVLRSDIGQWVVPTYHPSFILQGQQARTGVVIFDLQRAHEVAAHGFERESTRYAWDSLTEFESFVAAYNPDRHVLSYDIETPESPSLDEGEIAGGDEDELEDDARDVSYNIIRISFCFERGWAVSVPWQQPFIGMAQRLLASAGPKRVWNEAFDNPRLRANGCAINGRIYDVMWAWHFLQPTLPMGLGFVAPFYGWTGEPWKHLSQSEPGRYSCADSDALHIIGEGVACDLKSTGRQDIYERHVVEVSAVLRAMAQTGLPYSADRAATFRTELEAKLAERHAQLQELTPQEVRPSKQKHGYKKTPKDTTGLTRRSFKVLAQELTEDERAALPAPVGDFDIIKVERWAIIESFNANSPLQVKALILSHGHKPGRDRKTKRDTTGKDVLKRLWQRYLHARKDSDRTAAECYRLILDCRAISKVLGTYVNGWLPAKDGRVHATPGFWGKMFRISWRRPNISATIADKTEDFIAKGFRKCVEARPGHVLLESDWKGIEAVIVGYFAQDDDYVRLARIGVHDYFCAYILVDKKKLTTADLPSLAWDDAQLVAYFRDLKSRFPKDRDDAKHVVHGTNYGMREKLMAEMYEMTVPDATRLRALYFDLFPKIARWQKVTLEQASKECRLTNVYGYSMHFWEVFRWDSRRYHQLRRTGLGDAAASKEAWVLGDDAKSALSFLPRDTAAGMLKDTLLRLRALAEQGVLLTSTHDAFLTEVAESRLDEVAALVRQEMEQPVAILGGLVVKVEQKVGRNWDEEDMKRYQSTRMLAGVSAS